MPVGKGYLTVPRNEPAMRDGVQAEDGTIYIIYDYNRSPEGAVLMAIFTEEDVRAGEPVTENVRLRVEVARLANNSDERNTGD